MLHTLGHATQQAVAAIRERTNQGLGKGGGPATEQTEESVRGEEDTN
ncbi:hypothetical protein ES703_47560 [subsurface metagenome]